MPVVAAVIAWFTTAGTSAVNFIAGRAAMFFGMKWFFVWLIFTFGVGFVSFAGLLPIVNNAISYATALLEFPPEILPYVGMLRLDQVFTVWTSALTMILTKKVLFSWKLNNLKLS